MAYGKASMEHGQENLIQSAHSTENKKPSSSVDAPVRGEWEDLGSSQGLPTATYSIGLDLGTSHCALAYKSLASSPELKPQILTIAQWESDTTWVERPLLPSWYYLPTKSEIKRGLFGRPDAVGAPSVETLSGGSGQVQVGVVGGLARSRAVHQPQRVIHSAKSWLVASHVDRRGQLLPWGSDEIVGSERKSPVEVAAAYLGALRDQWNRNFPEAPFEKQYLTLTVPASFDEVAQRLTLEALDACTGGTHRRVKLLEEPQAAFYASADKIKQLFHEQESDLTRTKTILVCDIGGGTTDLSLFRMSWEPSQYRSGLFEPVFTRLAVSEHLLLGGDNIDLALARDLELHALPGESLSAPAFQMLVHSVRQLKEDLLGSAKSIPDDEPHRIGVSLGPSSGSSLFQGARSVSMTQRRIIDVINNGFFPDVALDEAVHRPKGGLRQLGLPYAYDTAVTRHLAEFLRPFYSTAPDEGGGGTSQRSVVDALLLVGGTLKPRHLQERLVAQIGRWQGQVPRLIPVESLDLAIAEGAAVYGYLRGRREGSGQHEGQKTSGHSSAHHDGLPALIGGGYPRSLYVEVRSEKENQSKLVCLIPRGFEGHHGPQVTIAKWPLYAPINQQARFQLWSSRLRPTDQTGDLVPLTSAVRQQLEPPLPPVMATLRADLSGPELKALRKKQQKKSIGVYLTLDLADTGVLLVRCVPHTGQGIAGLPHEGWSLDFNLRAASADLSPSSDDGVTQTHGEHRDSAEGKLHQGAEHRREQDVKSAGRDFDRTNHVGYPPEQPPSADHSRIVPQTVSILIDRVYGKKQVQEDLSPKALVKELEKAMGSSRDSWDLGQLRGVCDQMLEHASRRGRSLFHESTWMNLVGYGLRPGYGDIRDAERMRGLLNTLESGLSFSKERSVQEQLWILQRRVSGGMSPADQDRTLGRIFPMIRKNEAPSQEVYRLAGGLERTDMQEKIKLGSHLVQQIVGGRPPFLDQKVWTLGRIIGRTLLYAEASHIVSPTVVADWFRDLAKIPLTSAVYPRLGWVWSQGARQVEAREFNVDEPTRQKALERLRSMKAPFEMVSCVESYVPADEKLQAQLFGEQLPLGLVLVHHETP